MNILILSVSAGGGHNRAANAFKSYVLSQNNNDTVEILDALEYCSNILNKTVVLGYKTIAKNVPALYASFYKNADKKSPISAIVDYFMGVFAKKFVPLLEEKKPDVVVTCHPFPSNMMSLVKELYGVKIPVVSIITDYMPHRAYVGNCVDAYITASKDTSDNLASKYNVDRERIYSLGMPIFQSFYHHDEQRVSETLDRLGFSHNIPTVLVMAGSFGVTDILKIYERLVEVELDYQIIIITGKNRKLYDAFEKMLNRNISEFETHDFSSIEAEQADVNVFKVIYEQSSEIRQEFSKKITKTFKRSTDKTKPTKLFYFVDNVEDYMHASDLIITKPGGLTTSESLACGLPMALFNAFAGQEAQNADFLVDKQTAIVLKKGDAVKQQIYDLLVDKQKLSQMKQNCKNCAKTNASERIYNLIKDIINSQTK